jgi:hypothetical protein
MPTLSTVNSPCLEAVHAPLLMTLSAMSRPAKWKSPKTTPAPMTRTTMFNQKYSTYRGNPHSEIQNPPR